MCTEGAYGPQGCSGQKSYIIVDSNVKYCRVVDREFGSRELANAIIEQNTRWKNVMVISQAEYIKAWNDRFWND